MPTQSIVPGEAELFGRVAAVVARALELPGEMLPPPPPTVQAASPEGSESLLGVSSIDILHVAAALEAEFGVTIDDAELGTGAFESLPGIVRLVARLTKA
jgi:acyl carrier protein